MGKAMSNTRYVRVSAVVAQLEKVPVSHLQAVLPSLILLFLTLRLSRFRLHATKIQMICSCILEPNVPAVRSIQTVMNAFGTVHILLR